MMTTWPPEALSEFVQALPFEHLLRKRVPQEAMARWRIESESLKGAAPCRVALLLACDGDLELACQTIACWQLQTWPDLALVLVGERAAELSQLLGRARSMPILVLDTVNSAELAGQGIDWVVPAAVGDLLHPSLAGVVAIQAAQGATSVCWDWFRAVRHSRAIKLVSRQRGPWRDCAAELQEDLRHQAFAVPARDWRGHPVTDAWRVRMTHAGMGGARVHPEPLGIYARAELPVHPDPGLASLRWGQPFEQDGQAVRPSRSAAGVSVIILYRDRPELTLRAIESVLRQRMHGRIQLVLVDNQSSPETKATIQSRLARMPPGVTATVVSYDSTFNHSRQCNLGAQAATEEVLCLLNNDVELLASDALDQLARWALLPGVATVGACIVDDKGRASGGGFRARRLPGAEFNSPVEEATGTLAERIRTTVGNTFACAAISKTVFQSLGGLDEVEFPVGYNDVEFCLRASARGWRHVNLGTLQVTHAVGASRARTDEVAQKLALRCTYPGLLVTALQEIDSEPVALPETALPALSPYWPQ